MKKEWSLAGGFNGPDLYRAIINSTFEEDGELIMLKGMKEEIAGTNNFTIEESVNLIKLERYKDKEAVIISYCEERSLKGPAKVTKAITTKYAFSVTLKDMKVIAGNIKYSI